MYTAVVCTHSCRSTAVVMAVVLYMVVVSVVDVFALAKFYELNAARVVRPYPPKVRKIIWLE